MCYLALPPRLRSRSANRDPHPAVSAAPYHRFDLVQDGRRSLRLRRLHKRRSVLQAKPQGHIRILSTTFRTLVHTALAAIPNFSSLESRIINEPRKLVNSSDIYFSLYPNL